MRIDFSNIVSIVTVLGCVCVFILTAWIAWRKSYDLVIRRAADEWEKLAKAQELRIGLIERLRVEDAATYTRSRDENTELMQANRELVRLNLALQSDKAELSAQASRAALYAAELTTKIAALEGREHAANERIDALEREIAYLREHAAPGRGVAAEVVAAVPRRSAARKVVAPKAKPVGAE